MLKRIIDCLMIICFLILTAPQISNKVFYGLAGIVFLVLVIIHIYLNRYWFSTMFKGKFDPYRGILTAVNLLLILDIFFLILSGINLNPLLEPIHFTSYELARRIQLTASAWSYILIGIHLGMNWKAFVPKSLMKKFEKSKLYPFGMTLFFMIALYGGYVFNVEGLADHLLFNNGFAELSYMNPLIVYLNNLAVLVLWVFLSYQITNSIRLILEQKKDS